MPSFDVVSEVDWPEVSNAVDQANREVGTRFDFKGSDARIEQQEALLSIHADDEFKVGQVRDILHTKLSKRKIDLGCLDEKPVQPAAGGKARQDITIKHGLDRDQAKQIVKLVKTTKLKVQASVQGEQVRISGKKRDDLQAIITALREEELGLPLQFVNFRD